MQENILIENIPTPFSNKKRTSWLLKKDVINKNSTDINSTPSFLLSTIAGYLPSQDKINFALVNRKCDKAVYKTRNWDALIEKISCELAKINTFSFEYRSYEQLKEEKFKLFSKSLFDYYTKLGLSKDKDIEQQLAIFLQGMISLLTSPEDFKKSTTWSFWRYCHKKYLWLDDIQHLITQYVIHKNAETLLQHDSSKKLGLTIQAYINYLRKGQPNNDSAYIYGNTLNKIQTAIFSFQKKENKTTSQAKKAVYARQLSERIRSISNAFNRSAYFWARLSPRLCLFFGLIVFGLGLLLLASAIAGFIAAFSASAMIAMVVVKMAAFFKLTSDFFLGLTLVSSTLLALPVLAGGVRLFSQYSSYCYYKKMGPEVNSIADAAKEMAITVNKIN